jgi:mono/diheme cytochrome c family protein
MGVRLKFWIVSTGLLMGLAALGATAPSETFVGQTKPPKESHDSGAYLYRAFCATCHGATGKGDGPIADLTRSRPSDLTTIAKRRGGVFPRLEVTAIVDGRTLIPSHDRREMPIWGNVMPEANEAAKQKRIDAVVDYLASIQLKELP